jgi:hypothetical protein
MKETYRNNSPSFFMIRIYLILGIILGGLGIYSVFMVILGRLNLAGLFIIVLVALPSYLLIQSSRYNLQYKQNDKNKSVIVDDKARSLTIIDEKLGTKNTVTSNDIESIELYYSSSLNDMVCDLGYSKIILKNGSNIVVTQHTIGPLEIEHLFGDKVTQTKKATMNKLPRDVISL